MIPTTDISLCNAQAETRRGSIRRFKGIAAALLLPLIALWSASSEGRAQTTAPIQAPPPKYTPTREYPQGPLPVPPNYQQGPLNPQSDQQGPTNPFPKAGGDNQNRGKGNGDVYWGVLDANQRYTSGPISRVPDLGYNDLLRLDGWGYPRGASINGVFNIGGQIDVYGSAAGVSNPAIWTAQTAPSTVIRSPGPAAATPTYFRANAVPRPNQDPTLYPVAGKFAWPLNVMGAVIPGTNGQATRYRIFVHIPQPPDTQDATNPENRIDDARYTVYYYLRDAAGNYLERSKTFTVSQTGGGDQPLLNTDGLSAFFPFYSDATLAALPTRTGDGVTIPAGFKQGVVLDNTSEDTNDFLYVLADSIQLEQGYDTVPVTPTLTIAHGGRKAVGVGSVLPPLPAPLPITSGINGLPVQPRPYFPSLNPDTAEVVPPFTPGLPTYKTPYFGTTNDDNNSLDFINNPLDPLYNPATAGALSLETWNPSTLFQGPESLYDPRIRTISTVNGQPDAGPGLPVSPGTQNRPKVVITNPNVPTTQNPVNPYAPSNQLGPSAAQRPGNAADANNHQLYAGVDGTGTRRPVPFFSQMQVIVGRTEYALDPETSTPDALKDGTLTIQLGSVVSLDWLTGAPIWRFPDRTYLPPDARDPQGNLIPGAGLRNQQIGMDAVFNTPVYQIPGVVAVDKNLDGIISDDEVFIGAQNGTAGGGIFSSVTIAPQVVVQGQVQLPAYDPTINTYTNKVSALLPSTVAAAPGRYYTAPNSTVINSGYGPVLCGVAYIASSNGVIYAVDAYGNNDTRYYEAPDPLNNAIINTAVFGTYRPGTTNVLWSFSETQHPQRLTETRLQYYQRLRDSVPATSGWGASAPTLAYQKDEKDNTDASNTALHINPLTDELRLFAGNQNNNLYALDAKAVAGTIVDPITGSVSILSLPIRKGIQVDDTFSYGLTSATYPNVNYRTDLKWWFTTRGSIQATPAVSRMRQKAGDDGVITGGPSQPTPGGDGNTKGVYFTTQEGRLYCVDWDGPVLRTAPHTQTVNWDGTTASAGILNNNYDFHNLFPAYATGLADLTEGNIRPRWTYPNLYRDLGVGALVRSDQPADVGRVNPAVAGITLGEPEALGPMATPPMLMDFYWTDPDLGGATQVLSYVVLAADDAVATGESVTESRVYLLDQAGDRANFLTNPVKQTFGLASLAVSQPRDQYSPKVPLSDPNDSTSPIGLAWTYRYVYDHYTNANDPNSIVMQERNSPAIDNSANSLDLNYGVPGRKTLPTVYVGGVGTLYALDIDPETGVFQRWRDTYVNTARYTPLPHFPLFDGNSSTNGELFPGLESTDDQLYPRDPIFATRTTANLDQRRVLARSFQVSGEDASAIQSLTISGGPMQNRSNTIATLANIPSSPTVPLYPTNDPPNLRPHVRDVTTPPAVATGNQATLQNGVDAGSQTSLVPPENGITKFVNQEINDPLTTSRGSYASTQANLSFPPNPLVIPTPYRNQAWQYPVLFVSTKDGFVHSVSANIEGEDRQFEDINAYPQFNGESRELGWALDAVDKTRFNTSGHIKHFTQRGPGGPGGIAVVSNAYFPALDPKFDNIYRFNTATPGDLYAHYPFGEPNTVSPTPVSASLLAPTPVINNDDPRPNFNPRPFSGGQVGNTLTMPLPTPAVSPDIHTGQTGFPLDLNGLFFDKAYAGQGGATVLNSNIASPSPPYTTPPANLIPISGQHPNGDYTGGARPRIPAYSGIGGALTPVETLLNNQLPDGVQVDTNEGNLRGYNNLDTDIDINPAAQNVAWIYSGGMNGIVYAYTPALPGQESGFAAGQTEQTLGGSGIGAVRANRTGFPRVEIVDATTYAGLQAQVQSGSLARPSNLANTSIAATGGKNFYEWGESVYIVVYDVLARQITDPGYNAVSDYAIAGGTADNSIILSFSNPLVQSGAFNNVTISLARRAGGVKATYLAPDGTTLLGVALYKYTLGASSGTNTQVPGDSVRVSVTQPNIIAPGGISRSFASIPAGAGGSNADQLDNNPAAYFSIANPLAIQGFTTETSSAGSATLNQAVITKANANDTAGGIGPFVTKSDQNTGIKTNVQTASGATQDPDKFAYSYHQALTNGNRVVRRDLRPYRGTAGSLTKNPSYGQILRDATGGDEPAFYFPVVTGAGYINHGTTGSTTKATNQQNLRIVNRSLLEKLSNVRALPLDDSADLLWRSWPGRVPNADADPQATPANPTPNSFNNPRFTPAGMDANGRINPLPWETGVVEAKPWRAAGRTNVSDDYPDILTRTGTNNAKNAIHIRTSSGDLSSGPGQLTAQINKGGLNNTIPTDNITITGVGIDNPVAVIPNLYSVSANVDVPKYQPANLVAMHSLTSTYQRPNRSAGTNVVAPGTQGPVQLPRGLENRLLKKYNGTAAGGAQTVTPFGYTSMVTVFIDSDGTNRLRPATTQQRNTGVSPNVNTVAGAVSPTKAYREFEVWMGVPVDMNLKIAESVIDVGTKYGEPHGFGIDNGLLGYGTGSAAFQPGFLPPPLFNPSVTTAPYSQFFKQFTIQSNSNVNLWNVRASQRISQVNTGLNYNYLGMASSLVDPRFGILAVGADNGVGLFPQVVTSLDRSFDAVWDAYISGGPLSGPYQQIIDPAATTPQTVYQAYYAMFAGRHPLHKPKPGASNPSVLSLPDRPSNQYLLPVINATTGALNQQPGVAQEGTQVGVAIPIGTPAGTYSSKLTGSPFTVFEDHDTTIGAGTGYAPVPIVASATGGNIVINPAGPLYGGRNNAYPSDTNAVGGAVNILPTTGEGIWRPRQILPTGQVAYLPYAPYENIELRATVGESPLTGQVPDRALADNLPISITTGLLSFVDLFPVIDTAPRAPVTNARPVASLTPAAYRSANGSLHTYFSRNATSATAAAAQPGQPFNLFHSHLTWSTTLGTWVPVNIGAPLKNTDDIPNGSGANAGHWFSTPAVMGPFSSPVNPLESNVSPFVLNDAPSGTATLFWLNTQAIAGGQTYNQIYYASLDANGVPVTVQPYLTDYDAALQRFAPRAIYDPLSSRTYLFYYGGVPGKWNIYYSPRGATNGRPNGAGPAANQRNRELVVPLPTTIASASDPSPVLRRMYVQDPVTPTDYVASSVIDLYYTGIATGTQTPEVYMTRYRLGNNNVLGAIALPRIYSERLTAPSRDPVWASHHISWYRTGTTSRLPIIYVNGTALTPQGRWRFDPASGLMYQQIVRGGKQTLIYVDASAGTVRFRGSIPAFNDVVTADYEPQTYRITDTGTANIGNMGFQDTQLLSATSATVRNSVITRPADFPDTVDDRTGNAGNDSGVGRQYLVWQKGATNTTPATLFYTVRRVGIDLKQLPIANGGLGVNESFLLSDRDATTGNQTVGSVTYGNFFTVTASSTLVPPPPAPTGPNLPYEVDPVNGRIYFASQYEGVPVSFTCSVYDSVQKTSRQITVANVVLRQLDELAPSAANTVGRQVPMQRPVNEAQPYAFLDLFNPSGVTRSDPAPAGDPTLAMGRVWLFWSSSRGRDGAQPISATGATSPLFPSGDAFPGGYDVYWQTIAPRLEPASYSGLPPK